MLNQIIGKLRDEGLHLFVVKRRIITNESALAHLLQQEMSGASKMCITFICIHERNCIMQTNNNPFTEVGAIVLAAVLIIIAGLLLYVGKIDTAFATSMFILAGALFARKLAPQTPSPTQQPGLRLL